MIFILLLQILFFEKGVGADASSSTTFDLK